MLEIKEMTTNEEIDGKGYVHWKSWQETYTGLVDQAYLTNWMTLEKCLSIARCRTDNLLVAKDGEKVVGFVGYGSYRDDSLPGYGEIHALYLLREYQKQGIGYALMQAAMEKLAAYDRIALWVLRGNENAISFYKRYGFRFDGAEAELKLGTPATELRMRYARPEALRLVEPDRRYYASYLSAIQEYAANGIDSYPFLNPDRCDVLEHIARYRAGTNLPPNRVPSTYLWLVDGDEFVGEITIRHALTEALLRYGGHIGYGVRHSRWNQGCGTRMLALALDYAKAHFDFERVLITCDDTNPGSARVIEKNGGVLQDKIYNQKDDKTILTRRYWISLK